ncbi:hypothetical protein HOI83_00120 [Candidatus Uhrbacteria bacterium]|jgi:hypothetical protein|nr:hypothetical protein [Candidatus Uhrbacteria bacterium]
MRITKIGMMLVSVMLVGAGCTITPPVSCDTTTAHDSCISNGVDEALLGSWTLVSQQVSTPAGAITNPSKGRTLTFDNAGGFTENYSTETIPDGTALSVVSTCEITGLLSGSYEVESNLNLDVDPPVDVAELHIVSGGGSPTVKCEAGGSTVKSNAASTPLGVGPVSGSPPYVLYTYTMNDAWNQMTIVQTNNIVNLQNIYTFTR